ncbi:MAG: cell division protein SepF [Eubacterium sp.]|nr:cell division protein SepF [Eubacterium sp.]
MGKLAEKFLNMMRFNDDEEDEYYEDYEEYSDEDAALIDEAEEEKEEPERKPFISFRRKKKADPEPEATESETQSNVVPFNGIKEEGDIVKVIRPQTFNEAQLVADYLKDGKTIVVNLEGIEIGQAQRIIDFIGGASFAVDGSLKAISNNIFIVAPGNIEVSGDLRDEIVSEDMLSPELTKF